MTEREMEDLLWEHPEKFLNEPLKQFQRQPASGVGRADLIFLDRIGRILVIELKRGTLERGAVPQIVDYFGMLKSRFPDKSVELMIVANRIPQERRLACEQFHIDTVEIPPKKFRDVAEEVGYVFRSEMTNATAPPLANKHLIEPPLPAARAPVNREDFPYAPAKTEKSCHVSAAAAPDGPNEPWNGEFYCNYGHSRQRSWQDAQDYNFICAGGGAFYSRPLNLLKPGDRVWVKVPKSDLVPRPSFVGVARVTGRAQPAATFKVATAGGDVPVLEIVKGGKYHREFLNDPERCEYFVPVKWLQKVPLENAVKETGLFGNQNTVCKPTTAKWRYTVGCLKKEFPDFDK